MRLVHSISFMDPQQRESLYDAFAPAIHAFALQLTRHEEGSKDLLQSVFLRLARPPELPAGWKRQILGAAARPLRIESIFRLPAPKNSPTT